MVAVPTSPSSPSSPTVRALGAVSQERRPWVRAAVDVDAASRLASTLGVSARLARLLVSRGLGEVDSARAFLAPDLKQLPDPSTMLGLDRAAERLVEAIVAGERVALYGDYDVDGVTSTALLASFLSAMGLEVRTYIPQRLREGYGLNHDAVDVLAAEGTRLLVTLDCGITAVDEIARAKAHGIEAIVVDHHRCPAELPDAYATLNPHQPSCPYPDKGLAAVGVCFNLIVGVRRVLRARGFFAPEGARPEPNLRRYLDFVALGTIADMVPLVGVNRVLTTFGLEELRAARRPGMRALMEAAGVRPARLDGGDVGFKLGPRINAAGRLADASVGVQLLLAPDVDVARPLAAQLDHANESRQRIEAEVYEAAVALLDPTSAERAGLVVYDEQFHPGVVGIVASKLVQRYGRPVVVIGQGGRGSARTARGVHLYDAIAASSARLRKFGGHRAAAGLTIDAAEIPAFTEAFEAAVAEQLRDGPREDVIVYDDELRPAELTEAPWGDVERLAPFGNANPEPTFRVTGARVLSARTIGRGHLKLRLDVHGTLDAMAWKMGEQVDRARPGRAIDALVTLVRNEWQGNETRELVVKQLGFDG